MEERTLTMCRAANTPSTMAQQKAATTPKLMKTMAATSWGRGQRSEWALHAPDPVLRHKPPESHPTARAHGRSCPPRGSARPAGCVLAGSSTLRWEIWAPRFSAHAS